MNVSNVCSRARSPMGSWGPARRGGFSPQVLPHLHLSVAAGAARIPRVPSCSCARVWHLEKAHRACQAACQLAEKLAQVPGEPSSRPTALLLLLNRTGL